MGDRFEQSLCFEAGCHEFGYILLGYISLFLYFIFTICLNSKIRTFNFIKVGPEHSRGREKAKNYHKAVSLSLRLEIPAVHYKGQLGQLFPYFLLQIAWSIKFALNKYEPYI